MVLAGTLIGISVLLIIGILIAGYQGRLVPRQDPLGRQRAQVALHGASRRLQGSRLRSQIRSDTARIRQEMDRELRNIDNRGAAR